MAIFTGMLASAECIEVVADALRRHDVKAVVVDPVRLSRIQQITIAIGLSFLLTRLWCQPVVRNYCDKMRLIH